MKHLTKHILGAFLAISLVLFLAIGVFTTSVSPTAGLLDMRFSACALGQGLGDSCARNDISLKIGGLTLFSWRP